jgi:hypothetical protein
MFLYSVGMAPSSREAREEMAQPPPPPQPEVEMAPPPRLERMMVPKPPPVHEVRKKTGEAIKKWPDGWSLL